jgi:hypothetical protein
VAILSGARNYRHSNLSQQVFDKMKSLFSNQKEALIAGSILLSNTYLSVDDEDEAKAIRNNRIKQIGKKMRLGLTWTEVNGELTVRYFYSPFKSQNILLFCRNSKRTTILILNRMRFMLNLIVYQVNLFSMATSTMQVGSLVQFMRMKRLQVCYVAIVKS